MLKRKSRQSETSLDDPDRFFPRQPNCSRALSLEMKTTMSDATAAASAARRPLRLSAALAQLALLASASEERRRSRLSENNFHKHCNHFKAPVLEHNGVHHHQ